MSSPSTEPVFYRREADGRWTVLDQPGTPFWWATFESEQEARWAWEAFKRCLARHLATPDLSPSSWTLT